jgi:subtilisin family serine protease
MVLVAGAGNGYSQQEMYPAAYANVIAVGSSDYHDNLSAFSSFSPSWVSVLAPGTAILSTVPGGFCGQAAGVPSDCYDYKSGTSMSSPHVAGLAALLLAHNVGATNSEIRGLIESTADATGVLGQNIQAWAEHGRINMGAALSSNAQPTTHHVQSIVVTTVNAGRGNKNGQAVVTIVDNFGNPISGATVSGTFSGDYNQSLSDTTGGNGGVTLTTSATAKGGVAFTFCVDDVIHLPEIYDQSSNVLTCNSL